MLATLTDRRDFGDGWLLERKFDGERCVARKEGDAVRLSRAPGRISRAPIPRCELDYRPSAPTGFCWTVSSSPSTASRPPSAVYNSDTARSGNVAEGTSR
jgi:hypothetical protein